MYTSNTFVYRHDEIKGIRIKASFYEDQDLPPL